MKKVISFVIIITLTMGCNQNNEKYPQEIDIAFFKENDIIFRNDEFKNLLNELIEEQPIVPSNGYNSILVYLSLIKKDTILTLINQPPYEKNNLKAFYYYNKYRLYFYATEELEKKLKTFIEINPIEESIKDKINIHDQESLVSYQANYLVNGKYIKLENSD